MSNVTASQTSSMPAAALAFALMTVACWGLYGIFLHKGQIEMKDPEIGRYKAFLLVGIAYFLTAVLAPLAIILMKNGSVAFWKYPVSGNWYSLIAGLVGAAGAFCVLLAFGAKGTPPVVMSIIFAGAPIVNAVVSLLSHPPAGGFGVIRWQFYAGILLAALGGCLVTLYKPSDPPKKAPQAQSAPADSTTASATHTPPGPSAN